MIGQEGRIAVPTSNYLREIRLYRAYNEVQIRLKSGDTNEALCRINSVLDSVGSGPVSLYLGYLQYFKASIYRRTGNYYLAEICDRLTFQYGRQFDNIHIKSLAINLLGVLSMLTFKCQDARNYFNLILKADSPFYSTMYEGLACQNLAATSIQDKDTVACKKWLNIIKTNNRDSISFGLLRLIGSCINMVDGPSAARPWLKQSINNCEKENVVDYFETGLCYYFYAKCCNDLGERDSAIKYYLKAKGVLSSSSSKSNVDQSKIYPQYETVLIDCLVDLGDLYNMIQDQREIAFSFYNEACERILFLSHAITSEGNRFIIAEKGRTAFNKGIDFLLRQYESTCDRKYLDKAFEWSIQSKSLSLNWLYESEIAYQSAGIPVTLITKLQVIRKKLDDSYVDNFNVRNGITLDSINRLIRMYEQTEEQIRIKYAGIRNKITEKPLRERLSERLKKGELYLGFHDLDSCLVIFTFQNNNLSYYAIKKEPDFNEEIVQFREFVSSPPIGLYSKADIEQYVLLSHSLFKTILKPALDINPCKQIAFHTDGIALGIPFEALTTSNVFGPSFRNLEYLGNKYVTRYVSTAQLLDSSKKSKIKPGITILTCTAEGNIPEIANEVKGVVDLHKNSKIFYIDNDNLDSIFSHPTGDIHVSSHLAINSEDPFKTEITCQRGTHGVSFSDILRQSLHGTSVYINACESGGGPINHGEGLMSLGFAFALAGSKTIIQQYWEAPDQSSSTIAQEYYRLRKKKSPSEALRKAKLLYLENSTSGTDHPFYWAGVVCYTDNGDSKRMSPLLIIGLLFVIILVTAYLVFRKRIFR